jgi:hypothetical protein
MCVWQRVRADDDGQRLRRPTPALAILINYLINYLTRESTLQKIRIE